MVYRIEPIRATPVADKTSHEEGETGRRTSSEARPVVPRAAVPTEVVQISDRARRSQSPSVSERRREGSRLASSDDARRAALSLEADLRDQPSLAVLAQQPSDAERVWNLLRD